MAVIRQILGKPETVQSSHFVAQNKICVKTTVIASHCIKKEKRAAVLSACEVIFNSTKEGERRLSKRERERKREREMGDAREGKTERHTVKLFS